MSRLLFESEYLWKQHWEFRAVVNSENIIVAISLCFPYWLWLWMDTVETILRQWNEVRGVTLNNRYNREKMRGNGFRVTGNSLRDARLRTIGIKVDARIVETLCKVYWNDFYDGKHSSFACTALPIDCGERRQR